MTMDRGLTRAYEAAATRCHMCHSSRDCTQKPNGSFSKHFCGCASVGIMFNLLKAVIQNAFKKS